MKRGSQQSSLRSLVAGAMTEEGRRWGGTNGGGEARWQDNIGAKKWRK
jgi:hypothetical protein